jgi:GT2 family glycosyltransferase
MKQPLISSARTDTDADALGSGIAVIVLTNNRVHLLQKCVENVLAVTSPSVREIVIWNNGSEDGTHDYLETLDDPRITVVQHETNIGQNAYARAFAMTTSEYLVELDDDVVSAPRHWDTMLLHAFRRLPKVGFLAADLEDDPHDVATHVRYRIRPHEYTAAEENGVRLLYGPTGGACAITSRDLYERVGGFRQHKKFIFWQEEAAYINDIKALGYEAAVLADLKVHHTGGEHYGVNNPEKERFWDIYWKKQARRDTVKRLIVRVPGVRRLNARYGWFVAPS